MTSSRRHNRAPLRRSSTPEKILSAGLATATCVGLVAVIGARTVAAQAADDSKKVSAQAEVAPAAEEPTTSSGLSQGDLDAYAAQLEAERVRLDTYRAKLIKAGKQLQRQAARQGSAATTNNSAAANSTTSTAPRPAAKPIPKPVSKPVPKPVAKPAPKPVAKPAPHSQSAPQSNTKSS